MRIDYIRLGQAKKAGFPGLLDNMSDEDAGILIAKRMSEEELKSFTIPEPQEGSFSNQAQPKSHPRLHINDDFDNIFLPGEPEIPPTAQAIPFINQLVDGYHVNQGWWRGLFAESRLKVAALLADQGEHLFRLQKIQTESEAINYLRGHKLWNEQLAQLLVQQQAATAITDQMRLRLVNIINAKLAKAAFKDGKPLELYLERLRNDEGLRVQREEKDIEFEHHAKRERLATELRQAEIDKEVEGTIKLANTENLNRAQMLELIDSYMDKRDSAKTQERRQMWQEEINYLRGQLKPNEEPSRLVSEEDAGNDPEGGAPPPQSGNNNRGSQRPGSSSHSAKDSRHIH